METGEYKQMLKDVIETGASVSPQLAKICISMDFSFSALCLVGCNYLQAVLSCNL